MNAQPTCLQCQLGLPGGPTNLHPHDLPAMASFDLMIALACDGDYAAKYPRLRECPTVLTMEIAHRYAEEHRT